MIYIHSNFDARGASTVRFLLLQNKVSDSSTAVRGKETLGSQMSCAAFCDAFNMSALSPIDDMRRVTGRRHREEGRRNEEQ